MKGVPPEIDALMWRLAEDGGPAAQREFEARHVRYGPELARRVQMVAELRQAGRAVVHRPAFTPRPARVAPAPRWAVGVAIGLAVLAVGAVAYVGSSTAERPPILVVPKVEARPSPTPPVVRRDAEPRPDPNALAPAHPGPTTAVQETTPTYLKPRDLRIKDTALTTAIRLAAAGSGLTVTIAPGFPEQKVSLDYTGLSPVDILKAMGGEYGFTVLEEGEGQVLVLPARDSATLERRVGP